VVAHIKTPASATAAPVYSRSPPATPSRLFPPNLPHRHPSYIVVVAGNKPAASRKGADLSYATCYHQLENFKALQARQALMEQAGAMSLLSDQLGILAAAQADLANLIPLEPVHTTSKPVYGSGPEHRLVVCSPQVSHVWTDVSAPQIVHYRCVDMRACNITTSRRTQSMVLHVRMYAQRYDRVQGRQGPRHGLLV